MENIKVNFPKNQMLPHGYAVEWLPSEERYWFVTPDKNFESDFEAEVKKIKSATPKKKKGE